MSGECRDFLINNIDSKRLIAHDRSNRSEILGKFIASDEPLVLISPSMGEGVDLPGDLCRFQVIYKLPFPDWGDKQINQRTSIDREWYDYRTCLHLVQTHGRGMRCNDDYCHTYVIDSRFKSYVREALPSRFLLNTFKESVEGMEFDLKEKKRLMKIGDSYIENDDYESAIKFFKELMDNELFQNDIYPYLNLSTLYHETGLYESEVQTIIRFLSSGAKSHQFAKRLKELADMGYFDFN